MMKKRKEIMWFPLLTSELPERYSETNIRYDDPSPLVELLRILQRREYASELSLVTNHDLIHLTTAPTYQDQHGHPSISVDLTAENKIQLSYNPGVWHGRSTGGFSAQRSDPESAAELVDTMMIRMAHELDAIV